MEEINQKVIDIMYDVLDNRLEDIPLDEIEEVVSYMRRHYYDYAFFLDLMSAPNGDCWELMKDEGCKRDYLMHEIHTRCENQNVQILLDGIYNYCKNNFAVC